MDELQQELDELERTDPEVRAAAARLRDLPEAFARTERHLAARRAVGVRKPPKETA